MPLTPTDIDAYMVTDADRGTPPADYYPETQVFANSRVTPLVDGEAYFADLFAEISALGTGTSDEIAQQGVYILGWWLLPNFKVTPFGPSPTLIELLVAKAAAGVDVRIMVWANDFLHDTSITLFDAIEFVGKSDPFKRIQMENLGFIHYARANFPDVEILINHLDHPRGAAHAKAVLVFRSDGAALFTGGIDLRPDRFATTFHRGEPSADVYPFIVPEDERFILQPPDVLLNTWHDVQVKVEGPIVQDFYDTFLGLWDEVLSKPDSDTPRFLVEVKNQATGEEELLGPIYSRTLANTRVPPENRRDFQALARAGTSHAQSLFTLPPGTDWLSRPEDAISFAELGRFQIQLALSKAISAAQNYIYIEDQMLVSRELWGRLADALQDPARPNLRLLLMTGAADPNDTPMGSSPTLTNAINDFLLSRLTSAQAERVALFSNTVTVHSKLWIVDDKWAMVGSANMANRGLYTDIEHAVAFMDDTAVADLRIQLWGEHFGFPPSDRSTARENLLRNIEHALNIWVPDWGTPAQTRVLPSYGNRCDDIFGGPGFTWFGYDYPVFSFPFGYCPLSATSGAVDHVFTSDLGLLTAARIKEIQGYLFSWDDVPGNDNEKLIEFLKQRYGIGWVITAKIVKIDDDKTIKVSSGVNSLSLKLINEKTKVNLEINNVRTDKFIVKIENSKLDIYQPHLRAADLPSHERVLYYVLRNNLRGLFIKCTAGPNDGVVHEVLEAVMQGDQLHISFRPMPYVNDVSTEFVLLISRVRRVLLPPYTSDQITEMLYLKEIHDYGEAP